jgi:hypothetical protein
LHEITSGSLGFNEPNVCTRRSPCSILCRVVVACAFCNRICPSQMPATEPMTVRDAERQPFWLPNYQHALHTHTNSPVELICRSLRLLSVNATRKCRPRRDLPHLGAFVKAIQPRRSNQPPKTSGEVEHRRGLASARMHPARLRLTSPRRPAWLPCR